MSTKKGKLVHTTELVVRWGDMDAFGHVNNSVYFTYFEQARVGWWRTITPPDINFGNTGPVIIDAHCVFFKAITFPQTLIIKFYVGPAGRSSHECYYEVVGHEDNIKEDNIIYAEGSTKVVWIDRKLERSIPLPDYIKEHLPSKDL
jgi:acyl-CoA thioester hydrolase